MKITLQYDGSLADEHVIDFYDAARALAGFQRSLALVTHLALNGEIITQAPALKGAQIVTEPPEDGSWKTTAVILGGVFTVLSVGKDSPMGQIVTSIYDYVLYETMGFHVDYEKTLQQQYHEHMEKLKITKEKLDSLIEKTEPSIADIHRPIIASKTANKARLFVDHRTGTDQLGPEMSTITYDYIMEDIIYDVDEEFVGVVSSYNINTFKGRFFVFEEARPIAFELEEGCRGLHAVGPVTQSLGLNAADAKDVRATLILKGKRVSSRGGRLKKILVNKVTPIPL